MSLTYYQQNAEKLAAQYNSIDVDSLHVGWVKHLNDQPGMACDIGAGSGRDANWLAGKGWDVVAVEPVKEFAELGKKTSHPRVTWLEDSLPDLKKLRATGHRFNLVLLSAVWMHLPQPKRQRAFRIISELLAPGGILVITLRHGKNQEENELRQFYPASSDELLGFADQRALATILIENREDQLQRQDVEWETVVFKLPDDGTGSLPVLRHIIVNDNKSATYKLGLLRALTRIADGLPGMVIQRSDNSVDIPFGLVASYWLKLYIPLVQKHNIIQSPRADHAERSGYGWADQHFWKLSKISLNDFRIGAFFSDDDAKNVIGSLNRASDNIQKMPAHFITWPGTSEQVFQCDRRSVRARKYFHLTRDTLSEFGVFRIPAFIWQTMSQFSCWLEPAIVGEWVDVMRAWNLYVNSDTCYQAMQWNEARRDTGLARSCADALKSNLESNGQHLHCVWSDKSIRHDYAMDHCFPWSRWFNNDLWNLMPATTQINSDKSDKLPSAPLMHQSRSRILEWWESGYCQGDYRERFFIEAESSLPLVKASDENLEMIYDAMLHQRAKLKANQQLVEWTFGSSG
ncbi:MAG: class I SAM-dependent methyltransferase [Pseudomonadota bacterium]|nr:class I SAM-dependent methyltransferase [Pseudomonadota bacterium]